MTSIKKEKSRAFIGCTMEGMTHAQALQSELECWCYPERWNQGIFDLSKTIIEALQNELPKFNFAIFLLTPDDIAVIRGEEHTVPRDNLIFELGLSYAFLGQARTFIIHPRDVRLKLPSDIAGVIVETYDPQTPNLIAAFSTASQKIRKALQCGARPKPCDLCKDHLAPHLGEIGDFFYRELDLLLSKTGSLIFSRGVIRRNWTISLSYDLSKIDKNIITEKIIWDYEFINITKKNIAYPQALFMLQGDINTLVDLSRVDEQGVRKKIFLPEATQTTTYNTFMKKEIELFLPPGVSHFIRLHFLLDHPVCPTTHYIHNSFAPREPTMSATVKAQIPQGYRIDFLVEDNITPSVFGCDWDFRIPGPLVPEQIIEYIFKKEESVEDSNK